MVHTSQFAEGGSTYLQKAIIDIPYKFMAALLEAVPIYWMKHLVVLAEQKLLEAGGKSTIGTQMRSHWQSHLTVQRLILAY